MRTKLTFFILPAALLLLGACGEGGTPTLTGDGDTSDGDGPSSGVGAGNGQGGSDPAVDAALAEREVDYNEALRTVSLKLVRRLPTLTQIRKVQDASNPREAYLQEVDAMLADPAFSARMVKFWRDTMRMGGGDIDSAPVLAARTVAEGRPMTDIFTAASNNCPTFDGNAGAFVDGECDSGAPAQAGVLTTSAVQKQFYGNMGFRRVRWVQETFMCTKFPAEVGATPTLKDGKDYTSPWPFESISTTPINFQDTQSVVCANCHTTLNHVAPLFANFDADGMWKNSIQVMTPIAPDPVTTEMSHWLPAGETTAWRFGQEVADIPSLGQVLAEDPDVSECFVARMWNFAMSKEDIVADLATVPYGVISPYVDEYDSNGQDLKKVLRSIVTSDDFVSF